MLVKSKKILFRNFCKKFNQITNSLGIENSSKSKIQYYQYLVVLKKVIFMDAVDECKISESEEVFEGWKAMGGDRNRYVTKGNLKNFLIVIFDFNFKKSSVKNNSKASKKLLKKESSVVHSTIDLLKVGESEVRLDPMDDSSENTSIQDVYKNIKNSKFS